VLGDIAHPLAAKPDLALLVAEPVDILLSRARRHAWSSSNATARVIGRDGDGEC
jgi:hypothetical protein